MKPSQAACLLLPIVLGEVRLTIAHNGIQPVDAVLVIDGAPTYLRLTNSTSLENVYNCVLENSQNVNSVIMSTQMKGVQMDVGQVEENVNEVIRFLSAEAISNGRTLWKSPEELKLFKTRLARYLTTNYYDSKPAHEPDMYLNFKSQRSADWLYNNRGHQSAPNIHRMHTGWGEHVHEPRRQIPIAVSMYGNAPYWTTPQSVERSRITPTASALIPTAASISQRDTIPEAAVVFPNHQNAFTTESFTSSGSTEQHSTSDSPLTSSSGWSDYSHFTKQAIPMFIQQHTSETGIYPLKSVYGLKHKTSPLSVYQYGKTEPEITTAAVAEPEAITISVEGPLSMEKANISGMNISQMDFVETDEKPKENEEVQSRTVSGRRYKTERIDLTTPIAGRNVTVNPYQTVSESGNFPDGRSSDESSTEAEKPKKRSKGKRKSSKKRLAKSHQKSSMAMSEPKANGED